MIVRGVIWWRYEGAAPGRLREYFTKELSELIKARK
jgi:hypothetical protein